jgi:glycosyltransferase involved in cell wall biosynthesis
LHAKLSRQAVTRKLKTWGGYARELIVLLATDRVADPAPSPATLPEGDGIFMQLPVLAPRPSLSICISTYNRAGWLAVNLTNMLRQIPESAREVEVLVCDNASTDATEAVVAPYLERKNFRYVRNPRNVGMLGNLRVTANEARGEHVWILGDDDLIRENAVRRVLEVIAAHRDLPLIYLNYAYTHATDPEGIGDIDAFVNDCPPIVEPGKDMLARVKDIAANNENFFTAIYCLIFRRDHAIKAYAQNTDGRPFSTMRSSIPTTYYVLNHMMHEPAYWVGAPLLVVNFNVSWNQYAPLQILERVPEALDLAERMGASAAGTDRWRANLVPGFPHYFREMFENDPLGNSAFFSPQILVLRMKHLDAFAGVVPELIDIYDRAHQSGHPAAKMPTAILFSAF